MKKRINYIFVLLIGFMTTTNVLAGNFYDKTEGTIDICGFDNMSPRVPTFTSNLYTIVKIVVPIILVVMGVVDFIKATMASDEDKMKKSQKTFITRTIAAVAIFLVMSIVQFVFKKFDNDKGFTKCMDCILNNNCSNKIEIKMTCEIYSKLNKCPSTDDYGNSCRKTGNIIGIQCKTKGTDCSDFDKTECSSSKTTNGLSCEWVGLTCRKICSSVNSINGCNGHCEWTGSPTSGTCNNKKITIDSNTSSSLSSIVTNNIQNSNITGQQIVDYAMKYVGQSYVYGGTWNGEFPYTPTDCSGFTKGVYAHFGYELPRTANAQGNMQLGREVPTDLASLQVGDLLFFYGGGKYYHVVIYAGNGKVVHASSTKSGVKIGNYYTVDLKKAIRIIG